jgi:hypothetical protein
MNFAEVLQRAGRLDDETLDRLGASLGRADTSQP